LIAGYSFAPPNVNRGDATAWQDAAVLAVACTKAIDFDKETFCELVCEVFALSVAKPLHVGARNEL
tara:strand:+ start:536 stop:733 length:198 start_codon:yes stop_codon:yes gene_type:complete